MVWDLLQALIIVQNQGFEGHNSKKVAQRQRSIHRQPTQTTQLSSRGIKPSDRVMQRKQQVSVTNARRTGRTRGHKSWKGQERIQIQPPKNSKMVFLFVPCQSLCFLSAYRAAIIQSRELIAAMVAGKK